MLSQARKENNRFDKNISNFCLSELSQWNQSYKKNMSYKESELISLLYDASHSSLSPIYAGVNQ